MSTHNGLGPGAVGALRTFAGWVARGTVGLPILEGVDYWDTLREEPSLMETVFAVFGNWLIIDADGTAVNAREAERRAAQYIHQYMTRIEADPPFAAWETALHKPFGGQPRP